MGTLATTILGLSLVGAAASWVVGAVCFARCLAAMDSQTGPSRWAAIVAWPFAMKRLEGAAAEHAAMVNKAIVAFLVCITLAVVTISLSTNLNRIAK